MTSEPSVEPMTWAEQTFGSTQLGDRRRLKRAVQLGAALLTNPVASLPKQAADPAMLTATYQLLHEGDVTHTAVLTPHWLQTRAEAGEQPLVLLSGDTTILDYSHHPKTEGLGPIGNGKGRGYLVHSVLALLPNPRRVLGLAHQIPVVPTAKVAKETLRQKQARRRQTDVWHEAVAAIGRPPPGARWVHVGDRGSDIFRFLAACRRQGCDFLVRAAKNRRVEDTESDEADPTIDLLFRLIKGWPSQGRRTLDIPARHGRPARQAAVLITWRRVELQPPRQEPGDKVPIPAWVVRVWEPAPPNGTKDPISWVLVTSVAVEGEEDAWERVQWYTYRWTNEDYHQCLKTGCRIERRHLGDQPALERILAFCAPVAVHLLQIRDQARVEPETPAVETVDPEIVEVVAAVTGAEAAGMTIRDFWYAVARQGGYLGRKGDGPPGWKTLWSGWYDIQRILQGVRLARHLAPS